MKTKSAFTIVELLVVIVVIGILATITILSYTGITNKAIASSLQSDLTNASKQLDLFQVDYGYYPSTIDCGVPDSITNKCIKTNPANSFTYLPGLGTNPTTYTLTATHTSSNTNYAITTNSPLIATAPLNPVADWLAMPRGDHYGSFYDLVSKQYATVSRVTSKTIYDPTTSKIYDVPANTLGIRPRSDGRGGYEAEIEESRANLLKYSNGQNTSNYWSCSGSDGSYCLYNSAIAPDGTNSATTMNISGSGHYYRQVVTVLPSTTYTFSFYVKLGTVDRINYCIYDVTNALNIIAPTNYYSQINNNWSRVAITFTTSSNTTSIGVYPERDASTNGFIYFWGMQLEQGKTSTSYIPTISSSTTRAADVVSVPTANWATESGSIVSLAYLRSWNDGLTHGVIATGIVGTANSLTIDKNTSNTSRMIIYDSNAVYSAPQVSTAGNGYKYLIGRWSSGEVSILQEGSAKVTGAGKSPSLHPEQAIVGNRGGYWNDPIHRISIYDKFLSDTEATNTAVLLKDGL